MQQDHLKKLLDKYHKGTCTPDEVALLESWYLQLNETSRRQLTDADLTEAEQNLWASLDAETRPAKTSTLWPRIAAAASIILALAIGTYFITHPTQNIQQQAVAQDIAPGTNKAYITLANGKKIMLTGAANGLLTTQGGTQINITANGQVAYTEGKTTEQIAVYNTLSTPRGGQFALTLADGTKVWLDAGSSITYPVAFVGKERAVSITGQAYFEVAHNTAKPFKVTAANQTVEVLGTHFNVDAYADEPAMATTLLQGKIKISVKGSGSKILAPGDQAQVSGSNIAITSLTDADAAIAWHKGMFRFKDASITEVMRQLSRWYDVDVTYEGKIPDTKFTGELYRNVSALKVSDVLSYANIHFRIAGKQIIVTP